MNEHDKAVLRLWQASLREKIRFACCEGRMTSSEKIEQAHLRDELLGERLNYYCEMANLDPSATRKMIFKLSKDWKRNEADTTC